MSPFGVSSETLDKIRRKLEPIEVLHVGRYSSYTKLPPEMAREIKRIELEAAGEGKARGAGGIVDFEVLEELVSQGVIHRKDRFYFWIYRSPLIMKELDDREKERESEAREALLPKESRPRTKAEMRAME